MKYLWIALGGAAGAVARYWLTVLISQRFETRFPLGTFAINMSGCFLIGLFVTVLDAHASLPAALRYLMPIGFVGAYTTFSTFELETYRAVTIGAGSIALLNVVLSVVIGYVAVYAGVAAGKLLA